MKTKTILLTVLFALGVGKALAQEPEYLSKGLFDGRTILKVNLSSMATNDTYELHGERILSKHFSLQLGCSFVPRRAVQVSATSDHLITYGYTHLNYQALTPELRIYPFSRGYGHGFYIAPYYRLERYGLSGQNFSTERGFLEMMLSGHMITHNFGYGIGAQWLFGKNKNFLIDWNIIGRHSGRAYIKATTTVDQSQADRLSAAQRALMDRDIRELFGSSDSSYKVEYISDDKGVYSAKVAGWRPWSAFRMSLSLGVRF